MTLDRAISEAKQKSMDYSVYSYIHTDAQGFNIRFNEPIERVVHYPGQVTVAMVLPSGRIIRGQAMACFHDLNEKGEIA